MYLISKCEVEHFDRSQSEIRVSEASMMQDYGVESSRKKAAKHSSFDIPLNTVSYALTVK